MLPKWKIDIIEKNKNKALSFVHIPKTAGTYASNYIDHFKIQNLGHNIQKDKNKFTFTIIREPYKRFESILNFRLDKKYYKCPSFDWPENLNYIYYDESISLDMIVDKMSDKDILNFNHKKMIDYSLNIDLFITIEEFLPMLELLGYDINKVKINNRMISDKNRGILSQKNIERINKLYNQDVILYEKWTKSNIEDKDIYKKISKNDYYNQFRYIILNKRQVCDFELIINGGFAPLEGFMNIDQYLNCINNMKILSAGKEVFFPIPITLCINEKKMFDLENENYVVLKDETGLNLGLMEFSIYKPDIIYECEKVFGCYDLNHPYIQILNNYQKDGYIYNIGGKIIDYNEVPHYDFKDLRLSPKETKEFFKQNNWKNIIGFQTRNPMHRSHFELTKYALNNLEDSKLLLHPVVGITQDCDIDYFTRVRCYKKLIKYYENEENVKLSLLPLSMRMAGPREAVLHALIRKNYGCTHFIVGRDHAGPSSKKQNGENFYEPYEAQNLLMKYADQIGIIPIISKEIVYTIDLNEIDENNGKYLPIDEVNETKKVMNISGTQQRNMLKNGENIPMWFSFPDIIDELKNSINNKGLCIYFIGLSGAGKSTLANFLISKLKEITNKPITLLDGDIVRLNLSKGLGFSIEDRSTNVRRIGFVASEIVKHGGIVVCANIAPFENDREYNKNLIAQYGKYLEIFVDTDIETCEQRDIKGLYKLAREGKVKEFTGISSQFENPKNSEIILKEDSIENNINIIMNYLNKNILKLYINTEVKEEVKEEEVKEEEVKEEEVKEEEVKEEEVKEEEVKEEDN